MTVKRLLGMFVRSCLKGCVLFLILILVIVQYRRRCETLELNEHRSKRLRDFPVAFQLARHAPLGLTTSAQQHLKEGREIRFER